MKKELRLVFTGLLMVLCLSAKAQTGTISGKISVAGKPLELVNVGIAGTAYGAVSDSQGQFTIENIPFGTYDLGVSIIGYSRQMVKVTLSAAQANLTINFNLKESTNSLEQVVVTGTRTAKKITNSPVIVDIISSAVLENTQSVSLSEGLKYQPGLRVETNCQTCNYTQLRMNGLKGGYSQILINSRPIFSPLTGLYGMEQLPANMIERIEVVRGGGSALYGAGAVGGTVNVITKAPENGAFDFGYTHQNIKGANEHILSGNTTLLTENENAGATFFINKRKRDWWDANGDNFSEAPALENSSFGTTLFFRPSENQKIDVNISSLNEYRYGGEMVKEKPHLAKQSEERNHNVIVGNVDYTLKFNEGKSSLLSYAAYQNTTRTHYTGVRPELGDEDVTEKEVREHLEKPPYGTSDNTTWQGGIQLNHNFDNFPMGSNIVTIGGEYIEDDIEDVIEPFNYKIDQKTKNFGTFLQSDWEIGKKLNLLSGLRLDNHNLVESLIASPRFSLLYKPLANTQLRATWGTGFRAPQLFDSDIHITAAGGELSRVKLAQNLKHERSSSFSGSINYDLPTERYVWGFTLEGFHTNLRNAFVTEALPVNRNNNFGRVFEKRNSKEGAAVRGITVEVRANYDEKVQFDAGMTFQTSEFDSPENQGSDVLDPKKEFIRTPNRYGFGTLTFTPNERWDIAANVAYTGPMLLIHLAGAPELAKDVYLRSQAFTELGLRASYTLPLRNIGSGIELFSGVKNLTNAFQNDFDTTKNRDSNYAYGPALPRTVFFGIRIKSL